VSNRSPVVAAIVTAALLGAVYACETPSEPGAAGLQATETVALDRRAAVAVPFKAHAYTDLVSLVPDPACGAPPRFLNTQAGEGEGTHLGRFTVVFTFCVDATDLLDDGVLTPGESLPYDNGVGMIVAANGDELYLSVAGAVLPTDRAGYDFEFQDPFTFTGGTGRFEDAGGQGTTDSYVIQAEDRTDHAWTGWLTFAPGL
jgi:hypothetical protein